MSSTISSGDRPFARRSKMSLIRIRIPRIHGRPPHCSELYCDAIQQFGYSLSRSTSPASLI
jgi:hypothetical protein